MIREKSEEDYSLFIEFNKKRSSTLAENKKFKNLYQLNYMLYNILDQINSSFDEKNIQKVDSVVIEKYINMIKRDLVDSLDLLNLVHFDAAKRTYRSVIETVLRLVSYSFRTYVYKKRTESGKYDSTEQLKHLRSIVDTHKIGKLTRGILDELKSSIVVDNLKTLNNYYTDYSNIAHTNSLESVNFSTSLNQILNKTNLEIEEIISKTYILLVNMLIVVFFSEKLLLINDEMTLQDIYFMKKLVKSVIPEEQIDAVDKNFAEGLE